MTKTTLIKTSIILFASLIFGVIFFYQEASTNILDKPVIYYKLINGWPGMKLKHLPLIKEELQTNFTVKKSNNNYDLIIDGPFFNKKIDNENSIKIYYTGEAVRPKIDGYDLSIGLDYIDHPNYLRIPLYFMYYGAQINLDYTRGPCNSKKKFFACFLVSKKGGEGLDGCSARNSFFYKISAYKFVQSGGGYLNNIGQKIPEEETMNWLAQCKFVIAYENKSYEGYITEKPFQAYFAGAIPIYYGHNSTLKDLNPNAIILAPDFPTEEALVEYIKKVDADDKLYCDIWRQNIITKPDQSYESIRIKFQNKFHEILETKNLSSASTISP
jgi:hypothetical protein